MSKPTIAIGVPCYHDVAPDLLEDWMRWAYACGRRLTQFDFFIGIKVKTEQFRARNAIVAAAQQANADWLLMIDDDMIINPEATFGVSDRYQFLETLIAHDKDLCGVRYYQRGGDCAAVLMAKTGEKGYRFLRDDEIAGGLQRVDVAGGGCLLIKMRVFDRLTIPYFAPEHDFGTDIQLCRQAAAAGFEVWADTSIELGHLKQERAIVTSRNRHQHQMTDTVSGDLQQQFVAGDVFDRVMADGVAWTGYPHIDAMADVAFDFLATRAATPVPDPDWYRLFPKERVARQLWYNTAVGHKRDLTAFVLQAINHRRPLRILDFGCGIGVTAFALAEKGHQVTACDLAGTGTLDFLKWRCAQHGVPMTFHESTGGIPHLGGTQYDVIVAMDSIEHVAEWDRLVPELAAHLVQGSGVLFANNAILEDANHPEHYLSDPKAFLMVCAQADLQPINQITYLKRAPVVAPKEPACA